MRGGNCTINEVLMEMVGLEILLNSLNSSLGILGHEEKYQLHKLYREGLGVWHCINSFSCIHALSLRE